MISTITTTTTTTTTTTSGISPTLTIILLVFATAFLISVGFIYHLIRNNEYKDTLRASILIGLIISLLSILRGEMKFNSLSYNLITIQWTLFIFIMIIVGGFIAVGLKKLSNKNLMKEFQESAEKRSKDPKKWWDKQSPRTQAKTILIACLLCIILLNSAFYYFNPFNGQVKLGVTCPPYKNQTDIEGAMKEGTIVIFISNNSTQYTLKGISETETTVKITSSDLDIYNQTIPLDANGNFTYDLNIPMDVNKIKIKLEATKSWKDSDSLILTIKRR
ncbi:hypothetical protein [Methanobacterium ferruginis]|uniref:hypothetical protein n=1 Tax=Methanobacterium ferruginis TaxID=710191 RepID=UPI0025726348|nr:hypothetical protein [Methanobacterium ferruginis]BDZ69348.1 hypothetical protein GCM10025860_27960 [Methanobacterium ferruginis]